MDKIINEFLREYIETHAMSLLAMENSGLIQMIKQEKYEELKLMFSLFKRCPAALDLFKKHLKEYIIEEGLKLVKNDSIDTDELVKKILEFRQRMIDLLQKSLERD